MKLLLVLSLVAFSETPTPDPKKAAKDKEQILKMMEPAPPLKGNTPSVSVESTCKDPIGKVYSNSDAGYQDCLRRQNELNNNRQFPNQPTTPAVGIKIGK